MINFHPSRELLEKHSAAELPLSLAIAVSAHIEMCPACQALLAEITEQQAQQSWQEPCSEQVDFTDMLANIIAQQPQLNLQQEKIKLTRIKVAGKEYVLPTALRSFTQLKWSTLGGVSRARVNKDNKQLRSNLLYIGKNVVIPQHTHQGYELTLLLDGSFADQHGVYSKGDFIFLNTEHQHAPFSKEGCLCYAVQDAPLHFCAGLSQLLNPLAKLIY